MVGTGRAIIAIHKRGDQMVLTELGMSLPSINKRFRVDPTAVAPAGMRIDETRMRWRPIISALILMATVVVLITLAMSTNN
jgi:hypothetical protein